MGLESRPARAGLSRAPVLQGEESLLPPPPAGWPALVLVLAVLPLASGRSSQACGEVTGQVAKALDPAPSLTSSVAGNQLPDEGVDFELKYR